VLHKISDNICTNIQQLSKISSKKLLFYFLYQWVHSKKPQRTQSRHKDHKVCQTSLTN